MPARSRIFAAAILAVAAVTASRLAAEVPAKLGGISLTLSPEQLLAMADAARDAGDFKVAETAYRALFRDPSLPIRSEARFRLAMMLAKLGHLQDSAILLRSILDEEPSAQRVRLELARLLDLMGDEAGARRALREVQAGGLPPEVARIVDRYSAALRAQKPFGATFELAIAPDSNINRATRSDTLSTVLGDFTLDQDARARSGVGLAVRGQVYGRLPIDKKTGLLARVSGAGDFYRQREFNDMSLEISAGPEFHLGSDRLTAEAGTNWRWFGGEPYATGLTADLNYLHPLGRTSQLRSAAGIGAITNKRNRLQDGHSYSLSLSYERALSIRSGIGVTLSGDRQSLRDPGYSTSSGHVTLLGYREIGPMSLVATLSYSRLEADQRLAIFPERRIDDLYRTSLAVTFRKLRVGSFSPVLRVTGERNHSSIELFDYRRVRSELGVIRAF